MLFFISYFILELKDCVVLPLYVIKGGLGSGVIGELLVAQILSSLACLFEPHHLLTVMP